MVFLFILTFLQLSAVFLGCTIALFETTASASDWYQASWPAVVLDNKVKRDLRTCSGLQGRERRLK